MDQEKKYLIQCRESKDAPFYNFKSGVDFKTTKYICHNLVYMLGLENIMVWEEVELGLELIPNIPKKN